MRRVSRGGSASAEENPGGVKGVLHFDGGGGVVTNAGKAPAAFAAILSVEGDEEEYVVGRMAPSGSSHNVAEYNGLLVGLEHALDRGVTQLTVHGDSALVIGQMTGRSKVKAEHLKKLHARAQELTGRFESIQFEWVPRARNTEADRLASSVLRGEERFLELTARPRSPGIIASSSRDTRLLAVAAALEELARQLREIAETA